MIKIKYILFFISILFIISCGTSVDNRFLIDKEVDKKLSVLTNNKINKCRSKALMDAEIHVDSIISEITQTVVNKGIEFPDKPEKKDTDSISFNIQIDSVNLEEVIDNLKLKRDSIESNKANIIN